MTDIQKQPKLATKEQLRLAELLIQPGRQTLNTTDDAASQKRLKKVIELTNCTASAAEVALIDTEGSVEAAVALLLDKPDELVLWSQQGAKARNRAVKPSTGAMNSTGQQQFSRAVTTSYSGSQRRGDSQRGENRFRRDGQNSFEGKQGQTAGIRQKRTPSNRNGEQQANGHSDRAKSHERFGDKPFKPRGDRVNASGGVAGGYRRRNDFNSTGKVDAPPKTPTQNNATTGAAGAGWNANDNNFGEWNNGKSDDRANDANFPIGTFTSGEDAQKPAKGRSAPSSKNDEWKSGPRVFMPSTLQSASTANNSIITSSSMAQPPATNTSSWPSLDHNSTLAHGTSANASLDIDQPPKPKTFASVAASKKMQPPPPQPPPMMIMQQFTDIKTSSDAMGESSRVNQQQNRQSIQQQQPAENESMLLDAKAPSGNCPSENTWSTAVDWGVPISPRLNNGQTVSNSNQLPHSESSTASTMAPADSFGSSAAHSITVNQEYTNQLKSAIGLIQTQQQNSHQQQQSPQINQQQHLTSQNSNIAQSKRISTASSVEFFQQQMSQMHDTLAADASDFDKKVEFATGDLPPSDVANIASSYQFGFQFDAKNGIPSATPMNDAWSAKHISSVDMDRSMLKNSTAANVLSTMTNIPTTSSSVTAHFSTSIHPQHQSHDYRSQQQQQHRNASQPGNAGSAALSFTDTASVNYPPANNSNSGMAMSNAPSSLAPSTGASQTMQQQSHQQLSKTTTSYYTAANQSQQQQMHPSMMAAAAAAAAAGVSIQQQQSATHMPPPLTHHLQQHQPPQTIYHHHQTSTAPPPPASAVAQFPSYNMPYMYSPVAAQTLPGASAEIDRFLLQQYGPYRGLDMQLGAMTIGPPTTLAPSHRNQLDSYMDNKFGQQQQTVNQQGQLSQNPVTLAQQQRAGPPVPGDAAAAAAMFGGHVAPPPGFGMPTPPAQASYMPQPANLQSLFQMPTYHPQMSYQHQFMMPNANCLPQRPTAQTSPPEGNGGGPRHGDVQNYGGADSINEQQHSGGPTGGGGTGGHQSYVNKFVNNSTYRPYM